ncbi:MAG: hypothetical protein IMY72_00255 [Bacteroidetes bacterium]|nr:hypothetical protein [Bacteroidota bacterium]
MRKAILVSVVIYFTSVSFLFAQKNDYSNIDNHAKKASRSNSRTVKNLSDYLIKPSKNDSEKVRAFYVWITENITYDVKTFFNQTKNKKVTATEVLTKRKAVCEGYSTLFMALCENSGVKCYIIQGYSKGYGFDARKKFTSTDHAWNIVFVKNNWYLIDATWGSGYINDKKKFVKRFTDYFFLTEANKFAYTHLPSDPMWQLLDCPLAINDFKKDSLFIEDKISKTEFCFNYKDSIAKHEAMPEAERNLESAVHAYKFNPVNKINLGFAYLNYAYYLSTINQEFQADQDFEKLLKLEYKILEYNNKAVKYLSKTNNQQAKNALQICKQNLKATKHNINVYKQNLE